MLDSKTGEVTIGFTIILVVIDLQYLIIHERSSAKYYIILYMKDYKIYYTFVPLVSGRKYFFIVL